jgi:hypothetical protein
METCKWYLGSWPFKSLVWRLLARYRRAFTVQTDLVLWIAHNRHSFAHVIHTRDQNRLSSWSVTTRAQKPESALVWLTKRLHLGTRQLLPALAMPFACNIMAALKCTIVIFVWFFMPPSIATEYLYINSFYFSFILTTCFGPYGPSSGEIYN